MPGIQELLIIAGIMLLIFGGKKVPELMGGLGKGIKEFKRGILWTKEDDKELAALKGEPPGPRADEHDA